MMQHRVRERESMLVGLCDLGWMMWTKMMRVDRTCVLTSVLELKLPILLHTHTPLLNLIELSCLSVSIRQKLQDNLNRSTISLQKNCFHGMKEQQICAVIIIIVLRGEKQGGLLGHVLAT